MATQETGNSRLSSWKAIAAYLGKDVRTVIRWEQTRGLPIRRPPGEGRSSVYALTADIDRWLNDQPPRHLSGGEDRSELQSGAPPNAESVPNPGTALPHRAPLRYWLSLGAVVAVCLTGVLAYPHLHTRAASPTRATFTADSIQAWDDHDHLLWEHRFDRLFVPSSGDNALDPKTALPVSADSRNRAVIVDLFGDGRHDVLAIAIYPRSDSSDDVGEQVLYCFDSLGKLLWSYEPKDVLVFGGKRYESPWVLRDIVVSDEPGAKTIWINAIEPVWAKSFIAKLDRFGHSSIQFINSGEIATMQRIHTAQGPMLWIAGFNDEYDTASVAIMSDAQDFASSPQTPGTRFACQECKPRDPFAYFVFPRYDMSRAVHNPNNKIYSITSTANVVELHQRELSTEDQIIYDFDKNDLTRPSRVAYSSTFWPNHVRLEHEGYLSHALANCPDRLHPPPVRLYKNGVWTDVPVHSPLSN